MSTKNIYHAKLLSILLFSGFFFHPCVVTAQKMEKTYSSKSGQFKVDFQKKPKKSVDTITGNVLYEQFLYKNSFGIEYMVDWRDLVEEDNDSITFKVEKMKMEYSFLATFINEKQTEINGHTAIEFEAKAGTDTFHCLLILTKSRYYRIIVNCPLDKCDADEAKQFIKSFQLTN
jgi:hypothetical protein